MLVQRAFEHVDDHCAVLDVLRRQVSAGHHIAAFAVVRGDAGRARIKLGQAALGATQVGDQGLQLGGGEYLAAGDAKRLHGKANVAASGPLSWRGAFHAQGVDGPGRGQIGRLLQLAGELAGIGRGRGRSSMHRSTGQQGQGEGGECSSGFVHGDSFHSGYF